jgi:hypothetical protein
MRDASTKLMTKSCNHWQSASRQCLALLSCLGCSNDDDKMTSRNLHLSIHQPILFSLTSPASEKRVESAYSRFYCSSQGVIFHPTPVEVRVLLLFVRSLIRLHAAHHDIDHRAPRATSLILTQSQCVPLFYHIKATKGRYIWHDSWAKIITPIKCC